MTCGGRSKVIDRETWINRFYKEKFPKFYCSKCHRGRLIPKDGFEAHEPEYSSRVHGEDWHDFEMVLLRIGGLLKCSDSECGELASYYGVGEVFRYEDFSDEDGYRWEQLYEIKSIYPSPAIIAIPSETPSTVANALLASFNSFWIDYGLCANAIRRSLEYLLDHFDVPRESNKGKRLIFVQRIETLEVANPDSHSFVDAMRIFLNEGSHQNLDSPTLLFDAFEALEIYLDDTFGKRKERFEELKANLKNMSNN